MKTFFYSTIIVLFFLISCNNNDTNNSKNVIAQVDTSINHCFIYNEAGYEEILELTIKGNKIRGTGSRIEERAYRIFSLIIEGTITDDRAEITVSAVQRHNEKEVITIYETWLLGNNELVVKNRTYLGKQSDLNYTKVNCGSTPNDKRDSTLYDYFGGYYEGYAVVAKGGLYGLVDKEGKVTIPYKYKDLGVVNEGSIVFYDAEVNRKGLLDVNGNILVPASYSEIHCYNEGLAAFLNTDGKWGFFDKEGNVAIAPTLLSINFFSGELTRHPFNEGLANVQMENGWNFINTKGEVVIKGDYILAKQFENGRAEVYKNTKSFFIDKTGSCIENCD